MDVKKMIMLTVVIISLLSACIVIPRQGVINFDSGVLNDVVITNDLKELLNENPKPKVVIRVSNPSSNITEAEKFNSYINSFEKILIENGFTVRDRALLENLMKTGNVDYKTIREKIDTDIIIDILSMDFNIPNSIKTYYDKKSGENKNFVSDKNFVDCRLAKLECRLTIVSKGQLGGMITLYESPCDNSELGITINGEYIRWTSVKGHKFFESLQYPISNSDIPYMIQNLGQGLIRTLLKSYFELLDQARNHYRKGEYVRCRIVVDELMKKDSKNSILHVLEALLNAHDGEFEKSIRNLETAEQFAAAWHEKATLFYTYARVYALKGEKSTALSFLKKSLEKGMNRFNTDIRADKDLSAIAESPEFDSLLKEFKK